MITMDAFMVGFADELMKVAGGGLFAGATAKADRAEGTQAKQYDASRPPAKVRFKPGSFSLKPAKPPRITRVKSAPREMGSIAGGGGPLGPDASRAARGAAKARLR